MADDGTDFWFCANPDGSLKTVEREELVQSLKRGSLTGQSLVWRQGWGEWVAAGQVAELSGSVPAFARGTIITPKADPDRTYPPPVPAKVAMALDPIVPFASSPEHDKPGTLVMQEVELTGSDLEAVKPPPPSRAAPPAPSRRGTPPPRPAASADKHAPPPAAWTEVEPIVPLDSSPSHEPVTGALGDDEIQILDAAAGKTTKAALDKPVASSPSLDGLAAMVEAKKPKPAPMIAITKAVVRAPEPVAPPTPVIVEPLPAEPTAPDLSNAIVPVSDPDNDAPTQIHPAALRPDYEPLPAYEPEPAPVPLPAPPEPAHWQTPVAPQAAYAPVHYPSYAPPKKKSALPLVLGLLGVFGVLGAGAVGAALYFKPWESVAQAPAKASASAPPTPSAAAAKVAPKLGIAKEATRLSPAIQLSVPPYLAARGDSKVALGFATSETAGLGVVVNLSTLETDQSFTAPAGKKVIGVVPIGTDFIADRDEGALKLPHTIDSSFAVGFSDKGYSRQAKGGAPEALWSDVKEDKATEARVASVEGVGHALTFRTGGKVRVGWLGPKGDKKGELGTVDAEGRAGTPTVAAGNASILIAFAAKRSDDSPWNVQLATAKHGELPQASKSFALPAGGPGGDAIAPVAAGLPEGRWLLQWTEGGAGSRVVRAQLLDAELAPLGAAIDVSASGKEAGQGVIAAAGDKAVSFQLVKSDKGYELWGTALSVK